jgi:methionyl-tRNA synthetase
MEKFLLHEGIEATLGLVRRANAFVDHAEPWKLAKEGESAADRLDSALGALVRCLRSVAAMLGPFMPDKAAELWQRMGGSEGPPTFAEATAAPGAAGREAGEAASAGTPIDVRKGPSLFPRYDPDP